MLNLKLLKYVFIWDFFYNVNSQKIMIYNIFSSKSNPPSNQPRCYIGIREWLPTWGEEKEKRCSLVCILK